LGRFEVSNAGFNALTRLVLGLAGGEHGTLLVLEGGYDVDGESGTVLFPL
jgi:acetoin utilization deacetylase AcuC-like enzyme